MEKEADYCYTGYNKNLKEISRTLRKNMTRHEKKLWYDFLKEYPIRFYRQRPIGGYIVDFYCSKVKLVIELDGSQHYNDDGKLYDENRTLCLKDFGITVIRFSNSDIDNNFEGVCIEIDRIISNILEKEKVFDL